MLSDRSLSSEACSCEIRLYCSATTGGTTLGNTTQPAPPLLSLLIAVRAVHSNRNRLLLLFCRCCRLVRCREHSLEVLPSPLGPLCSSLVHPARVKQGKVSFALTGGIENQHVQRDSPLLDDRVKDTRNRRLEELLQRPAMLRCERRENTGQPRKATRRNGSCVQFSYSTAC